MVYYLAANCDLPLIDWNEASPAFHVAVVSDSEQAVAKHFSMPHLRYVGSRDLCGCAFRCGEIWNHPGAWEDAEIEAAEALQADHTKLVDYLRGLKDSVDSVEMYGCWSGDEALPAEYSFAVTLDAMSDRYFTFMERASYTNRK